MKFTKDREVEEKQVLSLIALATNKKRPINSREKSL